MPIHVGTVSFTGLKMTLYLQRVPTVTVENALESVFETALKKYAQCFWTRLETHVGLDTWAHRNMGTSGKNCVVTLIAVWRGTYVSLAHFLRNKMNISLLLFQT